MLLDIAKVQKNLETVSICGIFLLIWGKSKGGHIARPFTIISKQNLQIENYTIT
jgi:hypothetical protein